jgi:5,10-methylene-tetrahydrofolate dehydrogenase/methenyl tetrahydrofolate cyclohydrolase
MSATRLDGKACAADLEERLKIRISECSVQPHLAVIIVGDDPASHVYVNNKVRSCGRLGIKSTHVELPADTDQEVVVQHILDMNKQDDLHGILIQSPLPKHMDEEMLTELIDPRKDVDGFHQSWPSCTRSVRWNGTLYALRRHGNVELGKCGFDWKESSSPRTFLQCRYASSIAYGSKGC